MQGNNAAASQFAVNQLAQAQHLLGIHTPVGESAIDAWHAVSPLVWAMNHAGYAPMGSNGPHPMAAPGGYQQPAAQGPHPMAAPQAALSPHGHAPAPMAAPPGVTTLPGTVSEAVRQAIAAAMVPIHQPGSGGGHPYTADTF